MLHFLIYFVEKCLKTEGAQDTVASVLLTVTILAHN